MTRTSGPRLTPARYHRLPAWDQAWRRLPWVDYHTGEWSLTRSIAVAIEVVALHLIAVTRTVPLNALWLVLTGAAIAFGKSTFSFLISRMGYQGLGSQSDTKTQATSEIIDRRNEHQGLEASP